MMKNVPRLIRQVCCVGCLSILFGGLPAFSEDVVPDLEATRELYYKGDYAQCITDANTAISNWVSSDEWADLLIQSLLATGKYNDAASEVMDQIRYFPRSLSVAWDAYLAFQQSGRKDQARMMLQQIYRSASYREIRFLSPREKVAVGRTLLLMGGEPRLILDEFYHRAQQQDPNQVDAYLAAGELALAKADYALAATQFRKAIERFGNVPDAHYGLAKSFYHSDRKAMLLSLDAALLINPKHAPSLLLLAEHQIDAENYDVAKDILQRVLDTNPWRPEAWALRCVIAHLTNDVFAIEPSHGKALKFWTDNPAVDHLIGRKLSQRYWFAKGAEYQQKALKFDSRYIPARAQLAQDFLRLGDERGWRMANSVFDADQYNVGAYNLVTLRDHMDDYATLTDGNLTVRMDAQEAKIYGDRVMDLLKRAQAHLCDKYGLTLYKPISLELFKNQQDFAVRTFGTPGGDGFLGVCFGDVITANSPKLEMKNNWESTLWHEFCHVVTLNLTNNKMPRWLSEGLSVYEERQHDPTWGHRMNPQFRTMILEGDLTPVSKLSSAFMAPPTPMHLQFAYYESSLVVEYLMNEFGMDAVKAILKDLGEGLEINQVIETHTVSMSELEPAFEAFARQRAETLAKDVDWEQPEGLKVSPDNPELVTQWLKDHPNSFWALTLQARQFVAKEEWQEAKVPLKRLIELYPEYTEEGNAYGLLAQVHRKLNETDQERDILEQWVQHSSDAIEAYLRLMRMSASQANWQDVLTYGDKYLAVYPMLVEVHELMAKAAQALNQSDQAVASYNTVLALNPSDPAQVHYQLASLLKQTDEAQAKRHVLEALADAPRYRDAHELLLELRKEQTP